MREGTLVTGKVLEILVLTKLETSGTTAASFISREYREHVPWRNQRKASEGRKRYQLR